MSYPISNTALTDSFQGGVVDKINQIAYVVSTFAVTTAANSIGSSTTGNAAVVGILNANTFAAGAELRGGTVDVSANLNISSNTIFNGAQAVLNSNTSVLGSNLYVTATKTTIASANLIVTAATNFSNTVAISNVTTITGNTTLGGSNTSITSTNTYITSNTNFNANLVAIAGGSFTVSSNVTMSANVTMSGAQVTSTANVDLNNANTTIRGGSLNVTSNVSSNVIPTSNAQFLGNTTSRWNLNSANVDALVLTASNTTINGSFLNVNSLTFLRGNTTVSAGALAITSNVDINAANTTIRGGTMNVSSLTTFNANTVIAGNTLSVTANATFSSRVVVSGDLQVSGNLTFSQTSFADVIPSAPGYALGNTTFRWSLIGTVADLTGNVTVGGTALLNGPVIANTGTVSVTGANLVILSSTAGVPASNAAITINRGSSTNAAILWNETLDVFQMANGTTAANVVLDNGTVYNINTNGNANSANSALTSNNSTNFGGQNSAFYTNATNITSGTLANTRLSGNYAISITGTANNTTNFNGQNAAFYTSWANFTGQPNTAGGYGLTDVVLTNATSQSVGGLKSFTDISVSANLSFGSTTRQMLNLFGTSYAVGAQSQLVYVRTQKGFAVYQGGVHSDTENDAGSGGTSILLASNSAFTYKGSNVWHSGNYTPVVTVSGTSPAANGNVDLSSLYQGKSANLDAFAVRNIGATNANDIISMSFGDARYARLGNDNTLTGTNIFTVSPQAPTPADGTSSNVIATTAWALNKAGGTLTGQLNLKNYRESNNTLTISAGAIAANIANASVFEVSLSNNITSMSFQNIPTGGAVSWVMKFFITGAKTITWPAACKHLGGVPGTISTTSGDVATFLCLTTDGGTTIQTFFSGSTR